MTVDKAAYSKVNGKKSSSRKSIPNLSTKSPENIISTTSKRRASTDALDIRFDYEPLCRPESSEASDYTRPTDNNSTDDLQQLLMAIHKRYKVNSEKQEKEFKESLKQTVKKSVHEFQSHMDKFTSTMYGYYKCDNILGTSVW